MLRLLKSLFAWRTVRDQGVWLYQENAVTGARRAIRQRHTVWSPIDLEWLEAGTAHYTVIEI
ncbi:hypothetical protein [Ancylobacter oerskovii]|uniref:Uncharacterized protein n=1 Tax=Ancylobacter oerskovii TaxID=459519 RepID=A0ABW4Z1D9_9HYPH|nr:hypothetical protein [Ancylobacter oerskovii]MBS7545104.1 hypothetical protein [Ancylobacter oerskovii]